MKNVKRMKHITVYAVLELINLVAVVAAVVIVTPRKDMGDAAVPMESEFEVSAEMQGPLRQELSIMDKLYESNLISCDDLEVLAICVEAEAGSQSLYTKRLVVDVILNRVDDDSWPGTITEVIEQPYQFSSFWNGSMGQAVPTDSTYRAIEMELKERSYPGIYYFDSGDYNPYGSDWRQVEDMYFSKKGVSAE